MSETTPNGSMRSPDGDKGAATGSAAAPSICPAIVDGDEVERGDSTAESDPFAGSAEDVSAEETRRKIELFAWADSVLRLNEAELELELDDAVKHFKMIAREPEAHHRRPPFGKIQSKD